MKKNGLIITGQAISVLLFLLLGCFLIHMKIPGNGAICDSEQIILFETWIIFILLGIGLLINSWIFYLKKKWKKYRIGIILMIMIFFFVSAIPRTIIMSTIYGKETNLIEGNTPVYIKIKLYKNGNFFAYTYDTSCESENIGTYQLIDNKLNLSFKNEKSEYLGTEYQIENEWVNCLDCENKGKLKIATPNNYK